MTISKRCAILLSVFAFTFGQMSESSIAKQFHPNHQHPGPCAGGCTQNEDLGSLELIPFSRSAQSELDMRPYYRQPSFPQQSNRFSRAPHSFRSGEYPRNELGDFQPPQSFYPRRSGYQRSRPDMSSQDYQMRRENFTYANGPHDSSMQGRRHKGHCRGGGSRGHRGSRAYDREQFQGNSRRTFDSYNQSELEADRAPRLDQYPNQYSPNYGE